MWHLVFTSYDAPSKTLNIAYQQKGSASIGTLKNLDENYIVYQNNNYLEIESLKSNQETSIRLTDLSGKIVFYGKFNDKLSINCSSYINKILFLQLEKNSNLFTTKISIY